MKFCYTFFIILFIYTCKSQTYRPFPTDSATWGFSFISNSIQSVTKEKIKGDTLIGGKFYKTVHSHNNILIGFYRENSKKIFAKVIGYPDTSEILIFDFNLSIGDTFYDKRAAYTSSVNFVTYKFVLNSITTTTLTSDNRKQYNFIYGGQTPATTGSTVANSCNFFWIEGIGSRRGVFNNRATSIEGTECNLAALISNASSANLICFEHKTNQLMNQSCLTVDNTENHTEWNKLIVFPNPFKDKLTIDFNNSGKLIVGYQIINELGLVVLNDSRPLNNNRINITSNNLPKGIYLLKLIDEDLKTFTQKIIVE